ncbi:DEAD/DEAH box helicase [Deinococcus cellulosilyticus]|uniref:Helicase n=1 Tax=Deinococcus cellulosilyticus (strain DSM 18568 / NBRC 106333 / KACC 11606 / 5516J-15) TaxID=1223518 RepID=A0A511NBD5_DEIC1|nr:DEAD/DEAH box helicase [Deinococcus cellulosilyticus]GEM50135.1 hypothetical protein DC3_57700 [Deinococcus cellulosilyticus NBRC 106333 = KACC 11606]
MTWSPPPDFGARTFQIHFHPQDWQGGQVLQKEGDVLSCKPLPAARTITGVVREVVEEFRVGLTLNPAQFRGSCTCWQKSPEYRTCKHMVALLFHWFSPLTQAPPSGLVPADEAYLKTIGLSWEKSGLLHEAHQVKLQVLWKRNPVEVRTYLESQGWGKLWALLEAGAAGTPRSSLRSSLLPPPARDGAEVRPQTAPAERQLVFVLDLGQQEPFLAPPRLEPFLGALQQGMLLQPQRLVPGRTHYLPLEEEGRLLREVLDVKGDQHLHPRTPLGGVLDRLLKKGLLYLKGHLDRPLQAGEERQGQVGWALDARGNQHPHFQVAPAAQVLLLDQAWYVDTGNFRAGRVLTSHPGSQLQSFLTVPPVAPERVQEVLRVLQGMDGSPLPCPRQVEVQWVKGTPTFNAVLVGTGLGNHNIPQLSLRVDYGALMVPPVDVLYLARNGVPPLRHFDGQRLMLVERDMTVEKQAFACLQAQGLSPLSTGDTGMVFQHASPAKGDADLGHLLTRVVPVLKARGWEVTVDRSFPGEVIQRPLQCTLREDGGWFSLELGVEVAGKTVSLLPLLLTWIRNHPDLLKEMLEGKVEPQMECFLVGEGRFLEVELTRILSLLRVLVEYHQGGETVRLPRMGAGLLSGDTGEVQWKGSSQAFQLFRNLQRLSEPVTPIEAPQGLQAELRPYQSEGVSWLQRLMETGMNGILADDMGLGKTLQTLTHILIEKEQGRLSRPVLIVAPTSLMPNWKAEAEKFTPSLKTLTLHGAARHRRRGDILNVDVVFTTYGVLVKDQVSLARHPYHLIVLDEAQHIKNPRGQASQALRHLQSQHRLCLTGTPIENHLGELWSLFHFLMPGLLPAEGEFRQLYRDPIEKDLDPLCQDRLSRMVRPLMLRRTKGEVARDLPPKTEITIKLELGGEQRDLYETLRVATQQQLQEEIKKRGLASSQIHVLTALLKLRQVCCHPGLVRLEEASKVRRSVKLEWFKDTLPGMLEEGRTVLVFSQFTSLLAVLGQELDRLGVEHAVLTGQTVDRAEQVRRFQSGEVQVFLISLKAGGVGLNLTAADTVIHFDPWWNPAAENQATDRAYRIGQDKPVFVYKLVTEGTIEERILVLQEKKARLSRSVLQGGNGGDLHLSEVDVGMLLAGGSLEEENGNGVGIPFSSL